MSQTALTNLGVNYEWEEGDDGWKNGMDLNLLMLDTFGQAVVVSTVNADPWASTSNPAPGKMYIVGDSATGATAPWNTASAATIAKKLAIATGDNCGISRWHLITPKEGWTVFDQNTGEKMVFVGVHGSGGYWEYETKYLVANSRGAVAVMCGNDGAGPYTADRASPTYTLTREEAASQAINLFDASMLGAIDFTKVTPGAITGTGSLDNFTVTGLNAPEETWTLVCTTGGISAAVFSVTGSVSGVQASATAGTSYDNGIIAFDLTSGGTFWTTTTGGSADKITFEVREMEILYAAADSDVYPAMIGILTGSISTGDYSRCKISCGTAAGGWHTLRDYDTFDIIQNLIVYNVTIGLLADNYSHRGAKGARNFEVVSYSADHTLKPQESGAVVVMDTTAAARIVYIPPSATTDMGTCCSVKVFHKGANTLTISPGAGVTIVGTTAGTQNKFLLLERDGTSDTWYCG